MLGEYQFKLREIIEKEFNLNPDDFINVYNDDNLFSLRYKDSGLNFGFESNPDVFHLFKIYYSTFTPKWNPVIPNEGYTHLTDAISHFKKWLANHVLKYRNQENAPNAWPRNSFFDGPSRSETETNFTESDVALIANTIKGIKGLMAAKFALDEKQQEIVGEKLDRLIVNAKAQSKQDWVMFSYGVLANIATALLFDHQQGIELQKLFVNAFDYLMLLGPPVV